MNQALETLAGEISARFGGRVARVPSLCGELTFEVAADAVVEVCTALRDQPQWSFEQLIDLCGVDYLQYGRSEWNTESATFRGFSRGVNRVLPVGAGNTPSLAVADGAGTIDGGRIGPMGGDGETSAFDPGTAAKQTLTPALSRAAGEGAALTPALSRAAGEGAEGRFAVVYHLLSISTNRRLRLRAWCAPGEPPMLDSVIGVWKAADWFEREAFDLFGILFRGHPDLRRLLTDYGFIGHPFRKDFPLSGNVEVRYDPIKGRVVYEPVQIEPRTLVPRVIREDNRYAPELKDRPSHG